MKYIQTFLYAILAVACAYLLFFVHPDDPSHKDGRVVVVYWDKWTGREAKSMIAVVDDFNDTVGKQKGIYVKYISMSGVDQKTLIATAAGSPPDLAGLWDNQVIQYAEDNALQPLDGMAKSDGITPSYYKPMIWGACSFNGHLWALPSEAGGQALYYNKLMIASKADALRKAGLDPDRAPRTLAELDKYAFVLNEYETTSSGFKRLKVSGFLPMEPGWYLQFMANWFGSPIYDSKTDRILVDDPRMLKTFEWIRGYSLRLGKDALTDFRSGFGDFGSSQNPFITNTVGMEMQGPWMPTEFNLYKPPMDHWKYPASMDPRLTIAQRKANCTWGVAPFPSGVAGFDDVTFVNLDVLMIPRTARHKKEAFEFAAFANSQKESEKLNILNSEDTPLRNVSRHFFDAHPNPYIDVFEKVSGGPHAYGIPPCPIWSQVSDEIGNAEQRVYLLQATPEQAMQDAQKRIDDKYNDFKMQEKARLRSRS